LVTSWKGKSGRKKEKTGKREGKICKKRWLVLLIEPSEKKIFFQSKQYAKL